MAMMGDNKYFLDIDLNQKSRTPNKKKVPMEDAPPKSTYGNQKKLGNPKHPLQQLNLFEMILTH